MRSSTISGTPFIYIESLISSCHRLGLTILVCRGEVLWTGKNIYNIHLFEGLHGCSYILL